MAKEEQQKLLAMGESRSIWAFLKSARGMTAAVIFMLVALGAWYQFVGTDTEMALVSAFKSNLLSLVRPAANEEAVPSSGELSTAGGAEGGIVSSAVAESGWEIRKSAAGDSVWKVYQKMVVADSTTLHQNQTVNGLKNLTLVKNGIAVSQIAKNSLVVDKEYSFLSGAAAAKYAGKLAAANAQIAGGTALSDLSPDLQLAYKVANAPSYDFLYSLPAGDLQALYE